MTDVYAEHLCEHCCMVRIGANAPFPADYSYSVTGVKRDGFLEIVGFDHPKIKSEDKKDIIRKFNEVTGRLVTYLRAGPPPVRVTQIDPRLTEGRIVMTRKPHHASHATATDGTVDKKAVAAELRHVADLLDADKLDLRNMSETPLGDGWDRMTVERRLHLSLD